MRGGIARLQVAPATERLQARRGAETAVSVLGHALGYAEHGGAAPRFEQTAAPGGRPLPLVARSLRRRGSL